MDKLAAVTVADVQAAAQAYLKPSLRTVGWYVPTGEDAGAEEQGGEGDAETGGCGDGETRGVEERQGEGETDE